MNSRARSMNLSFREGLFEKRNYLIYSISLFKLLFSSESSLVGLVKYF
jgi:hypothetical protein